MQSKGGRNNQGKGSKLGGKRKGGGTASQEKIKGLARSEQNHQGSGKLGWKRRKSIT